MPSGVFETIMDFLPLPRVWDWALQKLKVRCKLNVFEAMIDTGVLIDEVIADMNIFSALDGRSKDMLIALNRTPMVSKPLMIQQIFAAISLTQSIRRIAMHVHHTFPSIKGSPLSSRAARHATAIAFSRM